MSMRNYQTHPDYWHLAYRLPAGREVWETRYRTVRGALALARIELNRLHLLARVREGDAVREYRGRDVDTLGDFLDPHPDDIARPFRRVR